MLNTIVFYFNPSQYWRGQGTKILLKRESFTILYLPWGPNRLCPNLLDVFPGSQRSLKIMYYSFKTCLNFPFFFPYEIKMHGLQNLLFIALCECLRQHSQTVLFSHLVNLLSIHSSDTLEGKGSLSFHLYTVYDLHFVGCLR